MLGLNIETHQIGDYTFEVKGDVLRFLRDNDKREFKIKQLDLWKLLIVKNPSKII